MPEALAPALLRSEAALLEPDAERRFRQRVSHASSILAPGRVGVVEVARRDSILGSDDAALVEEVPERVHLALVALCCILHRTRRHQPFSLPLSTALDGPPQDAWEFCTEFVGQRLILLR